MIESMNSLAIIQGQKIVATTVSFLGKRTIESMYSLAVIHSQKIVERTVTLKKK